MTFDSLPARLRDGSLRTMLTLQIKAGTLVAVAENERQRLEKLVELMQLARMAAAQFQHFTVELQDLIDRLTPADTKDR
jgi:ribosomal protein L30E